jgi:hypothetical protein
VDDEGNAQVGDEIEGRVNEEKEEDIKGEYMVEESR